MSREPTFADCMRDRQRALYKHTITTDRPLREQLGIPHRPEALPSELRDAITMISWCREELVLRGYLDKRILDMEAFEQGRQPPYWVISGPLDLELAPDADTSDRDARLADYEDALRLYRLAIDAWNKISPLMWMSQQLIDALSMSAWKAMQRGESVDLLHPTVLSALMSYGGILRVYASHSPVMAAVFHRFEAMANQIQDTLRGMLIDRLFSGELSGDDAQQAIEALEQHAASGLWPTPDLDLNKAEERWQARAS